MNTPAACGKRRYSTPQEALNVASHRVGYRGTRTRLLRVYHCPACNGWHLTKQRRRNR